MVRHLSSLLILLMVIPGFAQNPAEERIQFTSVTPSEQTGQDYSPWLSDDLNNLVANVWQGNLKYVDVTLKLEKKTQLTRLSLYDYQDIFVDQPAEIYALEGAKKTYLGKFEGLLYLQWVDIRLSVPVTADAILIHKFGNKIPQKIKAFGASVVAVLPPVPVPVPAPNPIPVPVPNPGPADKLVLDPKRWYQVNNISNGLEGLFDGKTDEPVNTGYGKLLANYDAYYPLAEGEEINITRLRFYDGQGSNADAPMTLWVITDTWQRIPIARFTGGQYNAWVGPNPDQPTDYTVKVNPPKVRYLLLNTSGAYPNEMELYGTYKAGQKPFSVASPRSTPLRQAIGVNAFEWNIEDARTPWQVDETSVKGIKTFSAMRHYMDWEKLESQPGNYTFNPTFSGSWNYDAMYERLKAEGVEVLACLKTLPKWLENTYPEGQRDYENTPARYGSDLSAPKSYIEQARVAFQYAARYGSNRNVNPALVKVSPVRTWAGVNMVKIGLGLVRYMECDNERDKTWKGRQAYQSGREYAANLSAFYDGHKNTLGPGVGVKNADPTMQVVIGGLAASTTDYVRAMIDWCKEFRGYNPDGRVNLCWDVMNQHLYANDAQTSQNGGGSRGAAPELSGVGQQAAEFVSVARQYAYDMPVWITEAGYDVNQGSPFRAIPIGNKSVLETQADWTLRTALLFNRVGIDRLFFYQMHDDNAAVPIQFYSMGLFNDDKTRKPAADYLYQTHKLFGAYSYKETISRDPLVDRYERNGQSAYMLVIPDEHGRTGTYSLPVGNAAAVRVHTPKIGSDDMTVSTLAAAGGSVTIPVTETPVFVIPSAGQGARIAEQLGEPGGSLATLRTYPNPTTDYVELAIENGSTQPVEVTIYDGGLGRLHKQVSLPKPERVFREKLDLHSLPGGLYMLEVRQGQERALRKVIKVQ